MLMNNPFKTVFVGASTTGKTTIARRLLIRKFIPHSDCTIGASFLRYTSDEKVEYEIWDTAGQERFNSLMPMYFKGAKIMVFVFDVSSMSTINDFEKYVKIIYDDENLKVLIVGNKTDLITEEELRRVEIYTKDKINNFGMGERVFDFIFVSTKTGANFNIFKKILDNCSRTIKNNTKLIVETDKSILLGEGENKNIIESKKCSCK